MCWRHAELTAALTTFLVSQAHREDARVPGTQQGAAPAALRSEFPPSPMCTEGTWFPRPHRTTGESGAQPHPNPVTSVGESLA